MSFGQSLIEYFESSLCPSMELELEVFELPAIKIAKWILLKEIIKELCKTFLAIIFIKVDRKSFV